MENTKTYEAMFLVDAGQGSFESASEPVRTVLQRSEAEVLTLKPWDERRLAYEIRGRRRGLYILTYFKMDPEKVAEMERDTQLNEGILRCLVLRRDKLSDEEIEAETPATAVAQRAAEREAAEESSDKAEASDKADSEKPAPKPEASGENKPDDKDDDSNDNDDSDDDQDDEGGNDDDGDDDEG